MAISKLEKLIETKLCKVCGEEFKRRNTGISRESSRGFANRKCCSRKCSLKLANLAIVGKPSWNKGLKGYLVGENNPMWKGGHFCIDCGVKLRHYSKEHGVNTRCRKCSDIFYVGKNSWNYKTGEGAKQRHSLGDGQKYLKWAKEVYKRDNYSCKECGKHCSKDIQAHHILPWKDFPEARFSIENGITLCFKCHLKTRKKELEFVDSYASVTGLNTSSWLYRS